MILQKKYCRLLQNKKLFSIISFFWMKNKKLFVSSQTYLQIQVLHHWQCIGQRRWAWWDPAGPASSGSGSDLNISPEITAIKIRKKRHFSSENSQCCCERRSTRKMKINWRAVCYCLFDKSSCDCESWKKKSWINKAYCSSFGGWTTAPFSALNKSTQWFEMRQLHSWTCGAASRPGLPSALQPRSGTPAEKTVR